MSRAPTGRFAPPDRPIRRGWTPAISVMLGSALAAMLPVVMTAPLLPPLGLMTLLGWRLLRPELLRVWAPVPLGLFDDLVSGAPLGSAMLLWTLGFFAVDMIDRRLLWRDFREDWLAGWAITVAISLAAAWLAWRGPAHLPWGPLGVQALAALCVMPLALRGVLRLDNWRQS